jgi:hypothetical protein
VDADRKPDVQAGAGDRAGGEALPGPPRLPERAAIYIAPDGSVHFGALFEGLLPVAQALGGAADLIQRGPPPRPEDSISSGSDIEPG